MFFPCPSEIIKRSFSLRKQIPSSDDNGVTRPPYLSREDHIRKTYGDNIRLTQIHGEPYLRQLYGYDNIIKSNPNKPIKIVKGEKLNCGVEGFLSNNGKTTHLVQFVKGVVQDVPVPFDSLHGKYLLISSFSVPMRSVAYIAKRCRAIIEAYDQLSSQRGCPFEMVVVAKLRTDIVYDLKAAFDHFYSAFSCLAIPFSDFETRHYIHSSITRNLNLLNLNEAILVDPQGIVLETKQALSHFLDFGSLWAPPFLPTTVDAITRQDALLRSKLDPMYSCFAIDDKTVDDQPLSLNRDILLCEPYTRLCRFRAAETHVVVSRTVLELSHKYVGLYLFIDGEIIEDVKAAHDHCLANNQQLEILLVPMLFCDEPNSYRKQLLEALRSLNINSWFVFLERPMVRQRLWRIFARGLDSFVEKLIIIPPDCKSGELYGREVIHNFGVKEYPFTRTAILKRRLEYVRSLPPIFSSLFKNRLMIQNGQKRNTKQLQGKKVLLYLTWSECDGYKRVMKHYPKIKAMGWELVFVLLDYTPPYWNKRWVDPWDCPDSRDCPECPCLNLEEMPWPYMPLSDAARVSVKKQLFFPEDHKSVYLFAVGKDGKIVSRDVKDRLDTDGVTESLFDDVLETDLANVLAAMPLFYAY